MKMNKENNKEYASLKIEKAILLEAKIICAKKEINLYDYASEIISKQNKVENKKKSK